MKKIILILMLSIGCSTVAKKEPMLSFEPVKDLVKSSSATKEQKETILRQVDFYQSKIKEIEEQSKNDQKEIKKLRERIDELNERLTEAERDAGFKDAIRFLLYGLVVLVALAGISAVIYLVVTGKLRIPWLLN